MPPALVTMCATSPKRGTPGGATSPKRGTPSPRPSSPTSGPTSAVPLPTPLPIPLPILLPLPRSPETSPEPALLLDTLASPPEPAKGRSPLPRYLQPGKPRGEFECDVCSKTFSCKSNLTRHRDLHTNERVYLCAVCGREFNNSSNRRKHERKAHQHYEVTKPWERVAAIPHAIAIV